MIKKLKKLNQGLKPKKYIIAYSNKPEIMASVACKGCNINKINVHIPSIIVIDSNDKDTPITPPEKSDDTDVSQPM